MRCQLADLDDHRTATRFELTRDFVVSNGPAGQLVQNSFAQMSEFQNFARNRAFDRMSWVGVGFGTVQTRRMTAVEEITLQTATTKQMHTFGLDDQIEITQLFAQSASIQSIEFVAQTFFIVAHVGSIDGSIDWLRSIQLI